MSKGQELGDLRAEDAEKGTGAGGSLQQQRDRFLAFAFASADVLVETDPAGRILFCAGATRSLLGRPPEGCLGHALAELVVAEDRIMVAGVLARLRETGRLGWVKVGFAGAKDEPIPILLCGLVLPQRAEVLSLTLRHAGLLFPRQLSPTSLEIAGPLEREGFLELAKQRQAEAAQTGGGYGLTLVELESGDFIAGLARKRRQDLTASLEGTLRAWSVGGGSVGRLDYGEAGAASKYGVIHDETIAAATIERSILEVFHDHGAGERDVGVRTASLGLVDEGLSLQDMAQGIAYTINRFVQEGVGGVAHDSLSAGYKAMLKETVGRVRRFRQVVASDRFRFAFQPVVDLSRWKVHHYEALSRFEEPETGKSPYDTLVFAEDIGLVSEFDLAVCEKAIKVLRQHIKEPGATIIAVNISGRSLINERFVDEFVAMLKKNLDLRRLLMFEITESFEIRRLEAANRLLQEVRRLGFRVCLDDFGAGAAAFQYLRNLGVDFVKIDGSYLHDAFASPVGKSFLKAIASLCNDLNLKTIGEMVEDELAVRLLQEVCVPFGQGYYLGPPSDTLGKPALPERPKDLSD
ncbi:MAG: EAL domain-containing protein [Proteobacteria bacterium]|nr:EAL domain-containing protein [Pseudomonadota bacterium]